MKSRQLRRTEFLEKDRIEQIVSEAFRTLERTGILVENDEALGLLTGAGAKMSPGGERVLIPGSLCEACMKTAPEGFILYDRDGKKVARIGGDTTVFDPGSAAISVYDFAQNRVRKPTTKDVVEFVVLTDRLDAFESQSTGIIPADVPAELADRYRLFLALVYGRKPVITGTFTKEAFPTMLAFLQTVRGGSSALREKPLAIFDCCPSPPLMWSDLTCQALIDCARNGIPAEIVSMPMAGATAPVTQAGALVQHTAETLSGIVIHQLANPGAPVVYGGAPACFDMRKGTTPLAAVEALMIDCAYSQIGTFLGFPTHSYMGLSDAKIPDFQAGFETAMGATLAALAGVNIVSGPGMMGFVNCQSLEKLVLDAEICTMARRLTAGIAFREKTAGYDVLREAAAEKSFLTTDHTRRYFRDEIYHPSDVIDRSTQGEWESGGSLSAAERAHRKVRDILDRPGISLPGKTIIFELESHMMADARRCGLTDLPDWRVWCDAGPQP
jgi:trimethylamine--corrinoid protein Co-methyltransferase